MSDRLDQQMNKRSNNFYKGWISHGGKVNVTSASLEQYSRLQQSRWCSNWFIAAYTAATIRNAFQWAGRPPIPSHWENWTHVIRGSLGPPESVIQTASRSVQPFLHGTSVWPTDRQTQTMLRVASVASDSHYSQWSVFLLHPLSQMTIRLK